MSVAFAGRALAMGLAAVASIYGTHAAEAAADTVTIAVFEFELDDKSAGGGIIAPDATDSQHLKQATDEARRLLAASGRYRVLDVGSATAEVASSGGIRHCNGCEVALAQRLGADQSMAGIITRVNRTEYTLQVVTRDARTGAVIANDFTGLRMGANYSWSRGAKWLVDNRILSPDRER